MNENRMVSATIYLCITSLQTLNRQPVKDNVILLFFFPWPVPAWLLFATLCQGKASSHGLYIPPANPHLNNVQSSSRHRKSAAASCMSDFADFFFFIKDYSCFLIHLNEWPDGHHHSTFTLPTVHVTVLH